ncbi:hypothetical protein FRB91_002543 [Serendipita sp. 411]|nr:hypothetical protein FRB91_002543 [Serendipita sp. 411]
MLFAAAVVALVSAAPLAFAQDLSVSAPDLVQCATSTISLAGTNAPYYVAVVPAQNPCESDAIAEFFNVNGPTVDYTVALPEGTQVQLYIADNTGAEYWSQILTVGGGDASCLGGGSASSSSSETPSSTQAPTTYVAPSAARASTTSTRASSGTSGTNNVANSPANAESDSSDSAGFKATASVTVIGGALAAAAFALF